MEHETVKPIAIGADIGGSHISCAAVNMLNHSIIPDTYASYWEKVKPLLKFM